MTARNAHIEPEHASSLSSSPQKSPSFLFGSNGMSLTGQPHHPRPQLIFVIWQTYLENVDPLLKIFHGPTTQRRILKATQDLSAIDPATEALMFAIYYATVMSMQPADCQSNLKEDRSNLLARYDGLAVSFASSRR